MRKRCSRCNEEKLLTPEFFHRCSKHSTGFKSDCKECRNKLNRKRQGSKVSGPARTYNKITDYKKYMQEYRKKNKDRIRELRNTPEYKERRRIYYENNKDRYKAYYGQRKERYKKYYVENKETISARMSQYHAKEESKQRNRIRMNKRKALKRSLLNTLTENDWNKCMNHFSNSCSYCGESEKNIHQDHFVPLSKGGEYTKYNIIPACETCNIKKSDRDFKDWYSEQDFYDPLKEKKILNYLDYRNDKQQIGFF